MSIYEERIILKIAFLVTEFPALSETFILNQITGLLDLGHHVEIFAVTSFMETKVHPDVKKYGLMERVHYFFDDPIFRNKINRVLKAIYLIITNFHKAPYKILKSLNVFRYGRSAVSLNLLFALICFLNRKFDIIHCHFGPNGIIGTQLRDIGIEGKIITTFHGYDLSAFISESRGGNYKRLFIDCDLCMPISNYWKSKLIEIGCKEEKITVHRMGADVGKFQYLERNSHPPEHLRILTLGRLVEKKGHEYGIRAVAKIINKHKNISYFIAGDGPLRKSLELLVEELKIKNHVNFLGEVKQDEVLKLYENAHVLIQPSVTAKNGEQEGIPVVLMEAQACGLPVISTYHSGIPEVVIDGKSGFLVPEKDVDALAERVEYLIEHSEVWPEMGKYGRKFVEERYDIKKLNQQLVEIYQNLIKDKQ